MNRWMKRGKGEFLFKVFDYWDGSRIYINSICGIKLRLCLNAYVACTFVRQEIAYIVLGLLAYANWYTYSLTYSLIHSVLCTSVTMFLFQCTSLPMFQCTSVLVYQCSSVPVQCNNVPMYQCTSVSMFQCTRVPVYQCTNVQVYQCTSVPMFQCTSVVTSWPL